MGNANQFLLKTFLGKGEVILCNPYPFSNRYIRQKLTFLSHLQENTVICLLYPTMMVEKTLPK
uniref:Putative ovule protein n=1 Tax=Solanum chacoense TaxID=4108 RepID=A0A0V0HNH6_SOLCH